MRRTGVVTTFLILAACLLLQAGCRSPWWPFGRQDEIAPGFGGPAAPPAAAVTIPTERPGSEGWLSPGPVPPRRGSIRPIRDQRWEAVKVYFAYDRSTIGTSERPKVEALADYLRAHPTYSVVVEGHCDERGSDEYNRALGERRALAVRDYLVNLGIAPSRIETVSYGEERPAVPNATTELEHAKNRRAEFVIGVRR